MGQIFGGADLGEEAAIKTDAGTPIVVKPPAITALLVCVQVYPTSLGGCAPDQVQPLVQLAQLHCTAVGLKAGKIHLTRSPFG